MLSCVGVPRVVSRLSLKCVGSGLTVCPVCVEVWAVIFRMNSSVKSPNSQESSDLQTLDCDFSSPSDAAAPKPCRAEANAASDWAHVQRARWAGQGHSHRFFHVVNVRTATPHLSRCAHPGMHDASPSSSSNMYAYTVSPRPLACIHAGTRAHGVCPTASTAAVAPSTMSSASSLC